MKILDSMTIEALARFVIGENCAGFEYRSGAKIDEFLRRVSPSLERQPGGRKQSVIDLLNTFNNPDEPRGEEPDALNPGLGAIVCRLVDPREFRGEEARLRAALNELNHALGIEGLAVTFDGVTPRLESVEPHLRPAGSGSDHKCPDFMWLTTDQPLIDNLSGPSGKSMPHWAGQRGRPYGAGDAGGGGPI